MAWFGLDNALSKPVDEAHAAVIDVVNKLSPLFRDVENRAGGILQGVLDRLDGTTITITVKIPGTPKGVVAQQDSAANPPPKEY